MDEDEIMRGDGSLNRGVRAFVQETGREKYKKLLEAEMAVIRDKSTGLLREDLAQKRRCPLCGADDYRVAFIKEGFRFLKCNKCSFFYVNPILNEAALYKAYEGEASNDAFFEVYLSNTQQSFDRAGFERVLKHLDLLNKPQSKKIMDVGCSFGHFLKVAQERGWDDIGVDLNEKAVDYANNVVKVKVLKCLLADAKFPPDSFDVVTLWNVLEHVPDPRSLVKDSHRLLKKGGILFIETPNIDSLATRIMHEKCITFGGRNHINYFSKKTVSRMLEEEGFELVDYTTVISELNTVINHLNYDEPYSGDAQMDLPLSKETLAKLIYRHNLGYRLNAFARKK